MYAVLVGSSINFKLLLQNWTGGNTGTDKECRVSYSLSSTRIVYFMIDYFNSIMSSFRTSEFQEENDHAEVPCVDEPSDKNVQDDMINPSSPSLVAPIVTKGDSSANRSGQVMYEDRDQILGVRP